MSNSGNIQNCCFTGHRPEKLNLSEQEIKLGLICAIDDAIRDGFTVFISGMSRGVDIWAAEIILKKRVANGSIKLFCTAPYKGFERYWSREDRDKYNDILQKADQVIYISEHYFKGCFQVRNCHMVNNSSRVISVYTGESGGTQNTIEYAKKRNVQVVNILDTAIL